MAVLPAVLRRRPVASASGAVVLAVIVGVLLSLFQPWKLWIDETVDEAAPVGAAIVAPAAAGGGASTPSAASGNPAGASTTTAAPVPMRFVSRDHSTSGELVVLEGTGGEVYLRFVDLRTDNGPDLKVYLSTNPVDGPGGAFDDDAINLGGLQGNIGNQNYLVPAGTDLSRFRSVVIWCDRFNSPFGAAPLL